MSKPVNYIFVYGTLRRHSGGEIYKFLTNHSDFYAPGYMYGELYEVGGYPGAVESQLVDHKVIGEIYQIKNHFVLTRLDEYEGCAANQPEPHEYVRKPVDVYISRSRSVVAWAYIYTRKVSGLIHIPSGDYFTEL